MSLEGCKTKTEGEDSEGKGERGASLGGRELRMKDPWALRSRNEVKFKEVKTGRWGSQEEPEDPSREELPWPEFGGQEVGSGDGW